MYCGVFPAPPRRCADTQSNVRYPWQRLRPILASQSFDAFELAQIARHDDKAQAPCVAGNKDIVASDALASSLQVRANVGRVLRCGFVI